MTLAFEFEDFKSIRKATLELERMNVLVGPNRSGKSSFLQGIKLLGGISTRMREARPPDQGLYQRLLSSTLRPLEPLSGLVRSGCASYRLAARLAGEDQPGLLVSGTNADLFLRVPAYPQQVSVPRPDGAELSQLSRYVPRLRSPALPFVLSSLREKGTALPAAPHLIAPGGLPLVSVLAYYRLAEPARLEAACAAVARVIPGARDLLALPVPLPERPADGGYELAVRFEKQGIVRASGLSEGTLLVVALATTLELVSAVGASDAAGPVADPGPLWFASDPIVLLLDDIDAGLHPSAQREVITLLRRYLEQLPQLHIVCTSHSPYLVDSFDAREVHVLDLDEDECTTISRLSDHPDFARLKGVLSTGEFWTSAERSVAVTAK